MILTEGCQNKNDTKSLMAKTWMIMKLTIILMFFFVFQVSAKTDAQRVTIVRNNIHLSEVFRDIEHQTGFHFFYDKALIQKTEPIDITLKDATLDQALSACLKGQQLTYTIVKNTVVIRKEQAFASEIKSDNTIALPPTVEIHGRVVNHKGEPLQNVSVVVLGTKTGTTTDQDGRFTLDVPSNRNIVLEISSVGFQTKKVKVGNQTEINITLEQDITGLSDVVVVGYGSQKKSDLTSAISSVSGDKLQETAAVSPAEALQGKVSGVQVQQTNGAPGGNNIMIRVRGASSITSSNSPLYVVDGYPLANGDLSLLSPNDIQSIEVLKDASASAIYGSRGGNGVVIITTKNGANHKGKNVELNVSTGIQQVSHRPQVMNTQEYTQWFIDGRNNGWIQKDPAHHKATDPNSVRENAYIIPELMYHPDSLPDTDWGDLIFRNAPINSYELNFSNNNENSHSLIGASYVKQQGIVIETDYQKFNLHADFSSKVSKRITLGGSIRSSYYSTKKIEDGKYGPVELSLVVPPIYPAYNPDGTFGSPENTTLLQGDDPSPLEGAYSIDWLEKGNRTIGKLHAELEIIPGLTNSLSIGGVLRGYSENQYRPSYLSVDSDPAPNQANARYNSSQDINWLIEDMLNYEKHFGSNQSLHGLIGFTSQKDNYESTYMYATNFPNDQIHTLNAGQVTDGNTVQSEHSLVSYLARLNYSYAGKYLLTATVRTDGSSRFGQDNKWGTFPSASLGWRISDENFMKNLHFINNQKIRISYGITGNNNIPNYGAIGLLGTTYYVTGTGSGSLQNAVYPRTIPNPDLGWEKTQQFDVGMDLGMFSNRVYLEADYYNSITKDLLLNVPVPTITGYGSQYKNIGQVKNQGWEFLLSTRNLVGNFKWTTDFNISFNKNKVLALGPNNKPIYSSAPNANNSFITEVGQPIANIFGYVFDGVYTSQEQLKSHPHLSTDTLGDPIIRDVNRDGVINSDDRTILGNNQPKFIAGFNNKFSYKNFDLSVFLNASYGMQVLTLSSRFTKFYHGDRNARKEAVNRYRSPDQPGDGEYFIANASYKGLQGQPSSYWVQDASFLRIKNVSLGYNFNKNILDKLRLSTMRVYFSVTNLYTFTSYWGFDPDVSTTGTGLSKGGDYSGYPLARTFLLGVNVDF